MVKAFWWNHGTKTLDFDGSLKDFLKSKRVKFRRFKRKDYPQMECWKFTTCHNIVLKHTGNFEDGAFDALKLHYAYMGDKARVVINSKEFSINYHR